jgi:hypothetical protein
MLELGWLSAKLLLKGKLLRDPWDFFQKILMATGVGSLILILSQTAIPFYLAVTVCSLITGAMMPYLLKDFKMK